MNRNGKRFYALADALRALGSGRRVSSARRKLPGDENRLLPIQTDHGVVMMRCVTGMGLARLAFRARPSPKSRELCEQILRGEL